jgi:hypothetical protein
MTRAEIHTLLGPPNRKDSLSQKNAGTTDFEPYVIGYHDYFYIAYSNDRVTAFKIDRIPVGCMVLQGSHKGTGPR